MASPVEVHSKAELSLQLRGNKAVLLDVHAEAWCAPCRALSGHIAHMAADPSNAGVAFLKMDADKVTDQDLLAQLSVTAFPTVLLFLNGTESGRVVGAKVADVRAMVERGRAVAAAAAAAATGSGAPVPAPEPMAYNA